MLGRGDLLAVGGATRTALRVVQIGPCCGAGKLLGLAAREPGAEPQAPPQPFARLLGAPHRRLPLMPAGAGNPVLRASRQAFSAQSVIGFQRENAGHTCTCLTRMACGNAFREIVAPVSPAGAPPEAPGRGSRAASPRWPAPSRAARAGSAAGPAPGC